MEGTRFRFSAFASYHNRETGVQISGMKMFQGFQLDLHTVRNTVFLRLWYFLIYLCFPNNSSRATISKSSLREWVDYARENEALILYDAAYEAFIRDDQLPKSIE